MPQAGGRQAREDARMPCGACSGVVFFLLAYFIMWVWPLVRVSPCWVALNVCAELGHPLLNRLRFALSSRGLGGLLTFLVEFGATGRRRL